MQKPFIVAFVYSLLFIATICFTFYGGHTQYITHAYLIGLVCMLPFVFIAILWQRQTVFGGIISGKGAVKEGLKFVLVSTLIIIIFQSVFFEKSFKDFKISYMQTVGPKVIKEEIAAGKTKLTEDQIPKAIALDVADVTLFKEVTSVIFKNIFYGMFSSFVAAIFLKRNSNG
jgi:hypothetical protein